jgi:hypothetical protein
MLKIALFGPIPSAKTIMAIMLKPGLFASLRSPIRTSCQKASMIAPHDKSLMR